VKANNKPLIFPIYRGTW